MRRFGTGLLAAVVAVGLGPLASADPLVAGAPSQAPPPPPGPTQPKPAPRPTPPADPAPDPAPVPKPPRPEPKPKPAPPPPAPKPVEPTPVEPRPIPTPPSPSTLRPLDLTPSRQPLGAVPLGGTASSPRRGERSPGVTLGDDADWKVQAAQIGAMVGVFGALTALCSGGRCASVLADAIPGLAAPRQGPQVDVNARPPARRSD